MHAVAEQGCAGVNFHGALSGPYTVIAYQNNSYLAEPIYYGILAFQLGGKGNIIPVTVANDSLNLDAYAVIDSMSNIFVTIVNKDTLQNAVVNIDAGATIKNTAAYVSLTAPAVSDTDSVTLAGQTVQPDGTFPPVTWQSLKVNGTKIALNIPAASALIVRLQTDTIAGLPELANAASNFANIYPNPASSVLNIETSIAEPYAIKVMDMEGKAIANFTSDKKNCFFNTALLANGIYLVELKGMDGTSIRKQFVKE